MKKIDNLPTMLSIIGIVCGVGALAGGVSSLALDGFSSLKTSSDYMNWAVAIGSMSGVVGMLLAVTFPFGLIMNIVGACSMSKGCVMASGVLYTPMAMTLLESVTNGWKPEGADGLICVLAIACPLLAYASYVVASRKDGDSKAPAVESPRQVSREDSKPEPSMEEMPQQAEVRQERFVPTNPSDAKAVEAFFDEMAD